MSVRQVQSCLLEILHLALVLSRGGGLQMVAHTTALLFSAGSLQWFGVEVSSLHLHKPALWPTSFH